MGESNLHATIGFATDKGVKNENEDFVGAVIPDQPQLTYKGIAAAIADGMSGCEAGKLASQSCIGSFLSDYYCTPDSWSVMQAGQKILSAANSWLYAQNQARFQSDRGMVSTFSAIIFKSTTAYLFHVGDCRIYRFRKGNLELLTRDHRIWTARDKHYLNRAMGIDPRLDVDYKTLPLEQGDVFLMSTDGIHDFIDDQGLKKLLASDSDLTQLANNILQQAKAKDSDDNLSCQLIRIESIPDASEDEILRRYTNLPFPPPLTPGNIVDDYRIEAELHASKRTQVYRAFDTLTNTKVILKTPSILYDDDTHYIEHFLHEEWAGNRIRHDNVVKVINSNRAKSCVYYVTEFVEGITLREWIKTYPKADIDECRRIVGQIAKGLRAFHRKEMLHQDLKPENIIINKQGVVKIIDFGSVKIAGIAEIAAPKVEGEENMLGTLNYSAPEFHLGQPGSLKSDLYSLAVITYEMMNGILPFDQDTADIKPDIGFFAKRQYVPSIKRNPMVPTWIDGALKKALATAPQLRYDDLSEFIYDLNNPNPAFLRAEDNIPLIQRNPLRFWQTLSLLLVILNLVLLYFVVK